MTPLELLAEIDEDADLDDDPWGDVRRVLLQEREDLWWSLTDEEQAEANRAREERGLRKRLTARSLRAIMTSPEAIKDAEQRGLKVFRNTPPENPMVAQCAECGARVRRQSTFTCEIQNCPVEPRPQKALDTDS